MVRFEGEGRGSGSKVEISNHFKNRMVMKWKTKGKPFQWKNNYVDKTIALK